MLMKYFRELKTIIERSQCTLCIMVITLQSKIITHYTRLQAIIIMALKRMVQPKNLMD